MRPYKKLGRIGFIVVWPVGDNRRHDLMGMNLDRVDLWVTPIAHFTIGKGQRDLHGRHVSQGVLPYHRLLFDFFLPGGGGGLSLLAGSWRRISARQFGA